MRWLVLVILLPSLVVGKNIFVSSPFDNFRIECPKKSGATELSVRMVESVGAKRQDIVFDMGCESIEEMYPWVNIPVGILEMEREDCYYSPMFDPILDEETTFSCKNREYFAGITRLTDTRIQVLCCRLRSRTEFNCHETQFNKPIGLSRSSIIESDNQLINAIRVNDRGYIVRFCDLAPRNIPDIYEDVKVTTERPATTKKESLKVFKVTKTSPNPYLKHSTPIPQISDDARLPQNLPDLDAFGGKVPKYTPTESPQLARINEAPTLVTEPPTKPTTTTEIPTTTEATTEATTPSTTTEEPTTTEESTTSSTTTTTTRTTTTQRPTTTRRVKTTRRTTTTTEATTTTERATEPPTEPSNSVEDSMEVMDSEIPENVPDLPEDTTTTASPSAKSVEDITMTDRDLSRMTFNNEDFPKADQKKLVVPGKMFTRNQLPRRRGSSSEDEFVFLPRINADGVRRSPVRTYRPHINLWDDDDNEMAEMYGQMGFTSTERKVRRKVTRAHRLPAESKEDTSMSDVSKEALIQNMMKNAIPERETLYLKEDSRKLPPGARQDLPAGKPHPNAVHVAQLIDNARFVDEETVSSPFEDEATVQTSRKNKASVYDRINFQEDVDIEDVINRLSLHPEAIRRAPVKNSEPVESQAEKTGLARQTKDGVKTHRGKENEGPIPLNELVIFDSKYKEDKGQPVKTEGLVPMMSQQFFGSMTVSSTESTPSSTFAASSSETSVKETTTSRPTSSDESTSVPMTEFTTKATTTTTEYDPANFYHTPRPKPPKKEKVLTFCTKDIAIRDERNMVVACGGELDVWVPNRCPVGTDCFVSSDSTYRICCPISKG